MATMEDIVLAQQTSQNLEGLRKNMRDNAQGYKADAASGRLPIITLAGVMDADASEYLRRLQWQKDADDNAGVRAKVISGLAALGIDIAETRSIYVELRDAALALQAAAKTDKNSVDAASDALLASVSQHDRIF